MGTAVPAHRLVRASRCGRGRPLSAAGLRGVSCRRIRAHAPPVCVEQDTRWRHGSSRRSSCKSSRRRSRAASRSPTGASCTRPTCTASRSIRCTCAAAGAKCPLPCSRTTMRPPGGSKGSGRSCTPRSAASAAWRRAVVSGARLGPRHAWRVPTLPPPQALLRLRRGHPRDPRPRRHRSWSKEAVHPARGQRPVGLPGPPEGAGRC